VRAICAADWRASSGWSAGYLRHCRHDARNLFAREKICCMQKAWRWQALHCVCRIFFVLYQKYYAYYKILRVSYLCSGPTRIFLRKSFNRKRLRKPTNGQICNEMLSKQRRFSLSQTHPGSTIPNRWPSAPLARKNQARRSRLPRVRRNPRQGKSRKLRPRSCKENAPGSLRWAGRN